jgi:hypothetical protein
VTGIPCAHPPDWRFDWDELDARFDWVRAMRGIPQDPVHHAEGDVWIHTSMVLDALCQIPEWRALGALERETVFAASLLHDVAKPRCTKTEPDGHISSRGHSVRGAVLARRLLWRMGSPFAQREAICALIRYHQVPFEHRTEPFGRGTGHRHRAAARAVGSARARRGPRGFVRDREGVNPRARPREQTGRPYSVRRRIACGRRDAEEALRRSSRAATPPWSVNRLGCFEHRAKCCIDRVRVGERLGQVGSENGELRSELGNERADREDAASLGRNTLRIGVGAPAIPARVAAVPSGRACGRR